MAANSTLQVAFLLDITGSMGSQIEGVKLMVQAFCAVERPNVTVSVGTYTESSEGCFVSMSPAGLGPQQLVEYVRDIVLGRPPEQPKVSASGDDGPENVVASVFSLTQRFQAWENVLCFIVTDAPPHHINAPSVTAVKEIEWLRQQAVEDTDIFKVLHTVVDSLNVTFVPILYQRAERDKWYQQAAVLTQGVILCPTSADSRTLANGLEAILRTMQAVAAGAVDDAMVATAAQNCTGFRVAVVSPDFEIVEADTDAGAAAPAVLAMDTDIRSALAGLIETTRDKFSGKKASKRARAVDPEVVAWSTKLLVLMMLQEVRGREDRQHESRAAEIQSLVDNMANKLGEDAPDTKLLFKLVAEHQERLSAGVMAEPDEPYLFPDGAAPEPVECMVALETAMDYLASLTAEPLSEADLKDWMEMALRLAMVRLVDVVFPLDLMGRPDFADAWSANIRSMELGSVMTASAAIRVRDIDSGNYTDPVSRAANSAAVVLAHPNDEILSRAYRIMSGLPSYQLLIQGYLLSGALRAFPAVASGLQASCLLRLVRGLPVDQKFTTSQWDMVRSLVWSLRQSLATPAVSVVDAIKAGEGLNPVDNIAKLLASVIVYLNRNPSISLAAKSQLLRQLFEEWSADAIARTWKWQQDSNAADDGRFPTQDDVVACFAPAINEGAFNPLTTWHPVELFVRGEIPLRADWKSQLSHQLAETALFKRVAHWFSTFVTAIHCPLQTKEYEQAALMVDEPDFLSAQDMVEVFVESFLLGKRTGRYTLDSVSGQWHRTPATTESAADGVDFVGIAQNILGHAYHGEIATWRKERAAHALAELFDLAAAISADTEEACIAELAALSFELLGQQYTLTRMDAVQVLRKVPPERLETLGVAVVLGGWTTAPPSQLRRQRGAVTVFFASCSTALQQRVGDALTARAICTRSVPNRTGHTAANFYPGMTGWTQEYDDARRPLLAGKPKALHSLDAMREYTAYAADITSKLAELGAVRQQLVRVILNSIDDPSTVAQAKGLIATIWSHSKLEHPSAREDLDRAVARYLAPNRKNRLQRLNADIFKCLRW